METRSTSCFFFPAIFHTFHNLPFLQERYLVVTCSFSISPCFRKNKLNPVSEHADRSHWRHKSPIYVYKKTPYIFNVSCLQRLWIQRVHTVHAVDKQYVTDRCVTHFLLHSLTWTDSQHDQTWHHLPLSSSADQRSCLWCLSPLNIRFPFRYHLSLILSSSTFCVFLHFLPSDPSSHVCSTSSSSLSLSSLLVKPTPLYCWLLK